MGKGNGGLELIRVVIFFKHLFKVVERLKKERNKNNYQKGKYFGRSLPILNIVVVVVAYYNCFVVM